jgi:hypothetical protein
LGEKQVGSDVEVTAESDSLTINRLREAIASLPHEPFPELNTPMGPLSFMGLPVFVTDFGLPCSREYSAIWPAHRAVRWISRFLKVSPWVHRLETVEDDETAVVMGRNIMMSKSMINRISSRFPSKSCWSQPTS